MARITADDLASLKDESNILSESPEDLANRLLKEALPEAVLMLTKLSRQGESETVQLKAATYITERGLGRLQDVNALVQEDPLIKLVKAAHVDKDA